MYMTLTELTVIMPDPKRQEDRRRAVRRLKEIEPVKVDLVDRAANKRRFLVCKEDTMPEERTAGPELVPVGDELHNPGAVSELERAASALESLTVAVEQLQKSFEKAEPAPAAETTAGEAEADAEAVEAPKGTEKGSMASAALREVAERAASLAAGLDEAADGADMEKLAEEVMSLVTVLQGIIEKYPSPKSAEAVEGEGEVMDDKMAKPQEETCKADTVLRQVAERAIALAGTLSKSMVLDDAVDSAMGEMLGMVDELTGQLQIEKSEAEPVLPEIFKAQEPAMDELADAMIKVLRDVADRATTVAKVADATELPQAVKDEIGAIGAILSKARDVVPTQSFDALRAFAKALGEVTERAAQLTAKADELEYTDEQSREKLKQVTEMLTGLNESFGQLKKSMSFEVTDMRSVLDADRWLNQFEAELIKMGLISEQSVEKERMEKEAQVEEQAASAKILELTEKLQALGSQVSELQASVAKARDVVPAAASVTPEIETSNALSARLFPMDYNDPAYQDGQDPELGSE